MKTAIIYKSKYGASKKYAEFLRETLDCDLFEICGLKAARLADYDTLILCGGLYAGGVSGLSFLQKNFGALKGKNLIGCIVGLSNPADEKNIKNIRTHVERALSPELFSKITLFHLRGGIDYSQLTFLHRLMMKMLFKILAKKSENDRSEEDREFIASYGKTADFIDKNTIKPIVDYVHNL